MDITDNVSLLTELKFFYQRYAAAHRRKLLTFYLSGFIA